MTRTRIFGSDTPFCDWMRNCEMLPSSSEDFGFSACDNDVTVHRYKFGVKDAVGTRDVQGLMQIEVKTRQGKPSFSQFDTLNKLNLFAGERQIGGCHIRFFGVFVLVLSGTTPDDSDAMWWCSMPKGTLISDPSAMKFRKINKRTLIEIMRFDRHPRNFSLQTFRRHHKTKVIEQEVVTELGFTTAVRMTKKS